MLAAMPSSMIATNIIPGYRILRQLGQGGSATTYLAIQTSFEREVALKIMSPSLNADPTFPMRFTREARIVAQMHHASIVPVFDVGQHRPYHYLSMEYLPGGDVRQRIVEGRCTPALALDVCMAISSALEVAHRKGFIHRDIKPQNILFREDGAPVLTDFGIARAIDVGTSLTVAGMFVGTPAYMSPEQVKGQELDARTDIYSLGMVFYEMLTGDVPFRTDSDSALSIAMKHLSETLPPLPPEYALFQPLIDRLTAKERDRRFTTATEVLHALRSMNDGQGSRVRTLVGSSRDAAAKTTAMPRMGSPPQATLPKPQKRDWQPWAVGASVIALVAAIVVGVLFLRPSRVQPDVATNVAQPQPQQQPTPSIVAPPIDSNAGQQTPAAPESEPFTPDRSPSATGAGAQEWPPVESAETLPLVENEDASPTVATQPKIVTARVAPTPKPAVSAREAAAAARRHEIDRLIVQAARDIDAGALTQPPGENAADRYKAVLRLDPDNASAQAGIQRIADQLLDDVDRARRINDVTAAQAALDQVRALQPSNPRIAKLQADIADRRVTLDKRSRKVRDKAGEHLTRADQLLARTPLVVKVVADAQDHYEEAAQLTPNDPALPELKQRIVFGYVTAAQYELNRNEPRRALNVVNYARRRNVTTPELDSIERTAQQMQH